MSPEENHKARIQERRARIEKMVTERKNRLLEQEEKKQLSYVLKENEIKDRRIADLEERVALMEKSVNQLRLDFSRYRARNKPLK